MRWFTDSDRSQDRESYTYTRNGVDGREYQLDEIDFDRIDGRIGTLSREDFSRMILEQGEKESKDLPVATIEEIHEDFDSAQEKLLTEAKDILKSADKKTMKRIKLADKVKNLGFTRSKTVEDLREISDEIGEKEKLAKLIEHYSVHYPTYKFITQDKLREICKKYGLVFGEAEWFVGEIPEKNMQDMVNFKVRLEDRVYQIYDDEWDSWESANLLNESELKKKLTPETIKSIEKGEDFWFSTTNGDKKVLHRSKLMRVVATREEFDMDGKEVEGFEITRQLPKDPIVLQDVIGGFLIITKWGPEADIKETHDPKQN